MITRKEAIQILSTRDAHGVLCGYTSGVTEALDMAVEALSKETTTDLISKGDALEQMAQAECGLHYDDCKADNCSCSYIQRILDIPSAKADWIPCSERLPADKTYVLTTIHVNGRQPHVRSGFFHGGFFHNDNGDTWRATEKPLKAWMPLPMPYREDGEV